MIKYTSGSEEVEAMQVRDDLDEFFKLLLWVGTCEVTGGEENEVTGVFVGDLENAQLARFGDYVVKHGHGSFTVWKPEWFHDKFKKVN